MVQKTGDNSARTLYFKYNNAFEGRLLHSLHLPTLVGFSDPEAESKEKHGVCNPKPELTITSPYVNSRVDSNRFTMGIPMPESTLSPSHGLCIWPQLHIRFHLQIKYIESYLSLKFQKECCTIVRSLLCIDILSYSIDCFKNALESSFYKLIYNYDSKFIA